MGQRVYVLVAYARQDLRRSIPHGQPGVEGGAARMRCSPSSACGEASGGWDPYNIDL
ncbi:MAG: hypothetical protein LBJ08_05420 [Bifidobacteriaceae bacterium]|nr:hypothetical protein [Bifidobacteriaceae bacterium]